MAGKIKQMLDRIIKERSKGNETIASTTRTKIVLKGINPSKFTASSIDDPIIIDKVKIIATEFGINL